MSALKLHHLRPAPGAKTAKTRVGRGEASKGKTAGRGTKGTKARYQVPERFEGGQMPLHMRMPKRGFNNPFAKKWNAVRLDRIQAYIDSGKLDAKGVIDAAALVNAGVIRRAKDGVRLINGGEFTAKKVTFKVDHVTKGAAAAIEAAGGKVDVLGAAADAE